MRMRKHCFFGVHAGLICVAIYVAGCDKPASQSAKTTAGATTNAQQEAAKPPAGQKICFQCAGKGELPCKAPGCVGGKTECPGPCMKLTRGSWIRMPTAGHDPNELWQKFPDANGRGYRSWSQQHVGEVVVYQNGRAENVGPCKLCGGTTKANC